MPLAVDRDRVLMEPFRVLESENDLSILWASKKPCGRHRNLLSVDWKAQPAAPLQHLRPTIRTNIFGQHAPAAHPGRSVHHSLVDYAYGYSRRASPAGGNVRERVNSRGARALRCAVLSVAICNSALR